MAKLEYSNQAKRTIGKFYRSDVVIYVEGDDDVVFWEYIFEKFFESSFYVKPLGGKENLKKYIELIRSGEIQDVVASDADFDILGLNDQHNNVVRTYGYSIENSLVSPESIREFISVTGKISARDISREECQAWLENFFESVCDLVMYDVWNWMESFGEDVIGENCARFMGSKKSVNICSREVSSFIESLSFSLNEADKTKLYDFLKSKNVKFRDLVRGHFLLSAAQRYATRTIEEKRKKIPVPNESFLGGLVMVFKQIFNSEHNEYSYYRDSLSKIQLPA